MTFVQGHGGFEVGFILLFMPLGILITRPFKIMICTRASKSSS